MSGVSGRVGRPVTRRTSGGAGQREIFRSGRDFWAENGHFWGQNLWNLMDGNGGEDEEKLDPLETKQIHGSKPTKSH